MSDRTPHAEDPSAAQPPTDRAAEATPAAPAAPETGAGAGAGAGAASGPGGAAASAPDPVKPDPVVPGSVEPGPVRVERAAMNEEDRAPWGLTIRVTFYLVGVHIFAAFLFLLFHLGAK
ncbi:hypothetical protein H8N01_07320 [Streptomyces sp. AC536]|uniref:DUF6126 family protein n=1 Tax=Streptomyces buecherae TaxID=2763006 RepID=UPI00164D73ED|nr:DUF6126 family protein [Streptomyces buecherae]MBC3982372.1 hypothetical protein [Streptomyces buecherae]QNJ39450.1 hypothetical protein H7H31_05780 [Streptomyces buecherae]